MREGNKISITVALLCIIAFVFSACDAVVIWPTKIARIKDRGPEYLGREVIVQGIVKEHVVGISEISEYDASFHIDDGTGIMIVLDRGTPPVVMSRMGVKGIVKRVIINSMEELAIQKLQPVPMFGPTSRDLVMAGAFLIVGLAGIIWAFNVTLFKWAMPRRDPEGARTLSNAVSYPVMLIFLVFLGLFLYRGYSDIPFWLLAGFAGVAVLVGIIFSIFK